MPELNEAGEGNGICGGAGSGYFFGDGVGAGYRQNDSRFRGDGYGDGYGDGSLYGFGSGVSLKSEWEGVLCQS